MKLIADPIILPDDADWLAIEDAKLKAKWHEVYTRDDLMKKTNLCNKCGSCKFFEPCNLQFNGYPPSHGNCTDGIHEPYRARTAPACKNYVRREN